MIRLCVICEGQTEAGFVASCLAPHLLARGILAYPSILRAPSGGHRGGRVTVDRLSRQLAHEYHEVDRLTTLVDFYGFQDRQGKNRDELERAILEGAMRWHRGDLDARFILPYVQMYEFEGLLFSNVEQFHVLSDGWCEKARVQLQAIRDRFATPEEINDGLDTAPSKRIQAVFRNGEYSKKEHGPLIAQAIGLEAIRAACPQFNDWLSKLEAWGAE